MSKKSKARAKDKRTKEKKALKSRMKALYESFRDSGKNSKRTQIKGKKAQKGPKLASHPHGPCGNIGCIKCHPINFRGFLVRGTPRYMPQWMYNKWKEQQAS